VVKLILVPTLAAQGWGTRVVVEHARSNFAFSAAGSEVVGEVSGCVRGGWGAIWRCASRRL